MPNEIHLFVSPHLDDVVLACGGLVRRLTTQGERVIVATLVTADQPTGAPISWLARRNHAAWRLGDAPFAARRIEDLAATQALGAEHSHLGLLDMMYRRDDLGQPLYDQRVLAVEVRPEDWQKQEPCAREKLNEVIRACGDQTRVYCPLAIGRHVDHVIVRHAVERICAPQNISYYEDFPYASQGNLVTHQLGDPSRWQSNIVVLVPGEIEARIAAAGCYASQIAGLFPSTFERVCEIIRTRLSFTARWLNFPPDLRATQERMARSMRDYVARVGGERYWKRAG